MDEKLKELLKQMEETSKKFTEELDVLISMLDKEDEANDVQ